MSRELPPPRAVLFDFGDTLLREGPVDVEAGARAVLALAINRSAHTATELAGALRELMADLEPRRRQSMIELQPDAIRRLVHEPMGLEFDGRAAEWAYWHAATSWQLEPDIDLAIDSLDRRDIPWAVLSNSMFRGQIIERQLALCGLRASHRFVMTSTEQILRKPHPRLFRIAAGRLNCAPEHIWFLGDSHEFDVQGAAAVGMHPLWYDAKGGPGDPSVASRVIHSWREFPDLLENSHRS